MTRLTKPVVREAVQRVRGDPAVVTLHPAGYVEIRRKGSREAYRLSFDQIFYEGARRQAEQSRWQEASRRRSRSR